MANGSSISGISFNDSDQDGQFKAPDSTNVRKVNLYLKGKVIQQVMSNAEGVYAFTNLGAGSYAVGREYPKGFKMSNPTSAGGNLIEVTLADGESRIGVNIGSRVDDGKPSAAFPLTGSTITGHVFGDSDGDGKYSSTDSSGADRIVRLSVAANEVATVLSNSASVYTFSGLAPGSYSITRDYPKGYKMANPTTPGGSIIEIILGENETKTVDIGSIGTSDSGGVVIVDPPVPLPDENDNQNPTRTVIRGSICETSKAEAKMKECGFTLWRDWISVNWNNGNINDAKDIAGVNDKVKRGWQVIATVTVDEKKARDKRGGTMCNDFSVVADKIIAAGLDKSVIVQLVNEANLDGYWPKGNVAESTIKFAVPIAKKLKAAGYKVAAPSITYGGTKQITEWVDNAIMANSPTGLWDYLDGHLYSDLNQFKVTFANWAVLGKKYGVKVMSSEWSSKIGNPAFAKLVKDFYKVMDQYCDIHCNFSFTYGSKFNPMNTYCWKDGQTTETFDAIKKILNP